jgi:hypothetical protein
MKVIIWWRLSDEGYYIWWRLSDEGYYLMKVIIWWRLLSDEGYLMKVIIWWRLLSDEGYSRNVWCTLNQIPTFLLRYGYISVSQSIEIVQVYGDY